MTQNLWDAAKAVLRGKFIAILPQEKRKISNKPPNLTPKAIREKKNNNNNKNPKVSRRNHKAQIRNQ